MLEIMRDLILDIIAISLGLLVGLAIFTAVVVGGIHIVF